MFVRLVLVAFLVTVLAWSAFAHGSEGAGSGQPYRVRAGDTLWSIAVDHYGGDPRAAVWRLQQTNDVRDGVLTPGQVLRLP